MPIEPGTTLLHYTLTALTKILQILRPHVRLWTVPGYQIAVNGRCEATQVAPLHGQK